MKTLQELCEGAWGYEPGQNDSTLDLRSDMWNMICENIYDKCEQRISSKTKKSNYDLAQLAWDALGNLEYFIDTFAHCDGFPIKNYDFGLYYYWYRLISKTGKNVFDLYERCLNLCQNCSEWIDSWSDPKLMQNSLEHRNAILKTWKMLYIKYLDFEAEFENQTQSQAY